MDASPPLWRQAERLARQGAAPQAQMTKLVLLWLFISMPGCIYKPFFGSQRGGQQTQEVPRTKY